MKYPVTIDSYFPKEPAMNTTNTSPLRSQGPPWVRLIATFALCIVGLSAHAGPLRYQTLVEKREARTLECDVAVYGGTPAGVTAAVQAARLGKSVIFISFNGFVGGMTSGGLTATDLGEKESVGGMALEFYQRVGGLKYFSPSKAEELYLKMLEEAGDDKGVVDDKGAAIKRTKDKAGVTLLLNRPLVSSTIESARIVSIGLQTGETVRARMFIDATYEGDLLAAANVSYRVGREPKGTYAESLAGQWQTLSAKDVYQFCRLPISPYVVADDPKSGLLPEISQEKAGPEGEGDNKVQAYNFRMYLSDKEGKIPFPKPEGYDPARYGLLARFLNIDNAIEWTLHYTVKPMTDGPVQMRNGDSNNAGSFSSDFIGGCHQWPDGTYTPGSFTEVPAPRRGLAMPLPELYELREGIFQDHVRYQQGLMYFLANDTQVPDALRQRVNRFGLDPKEFVGTGHWPHQLYIREGRRMVSDYVITQADCESTRIAEDSIGLASYAMDSHFCQRAVVEENGKATVRNDGNFSKKCPKPYPVSYRSIVPKKNECENLLVPVSLSASHVAFGSIRMEPVFMILGQSAGTAAVIAIDKETTVQQVDYKELKQKLLDAGQKL